MVKETWPVTERGKGEIPGQAARTVNPAVNRQKHGQSMGPQAWHPAADIGSAGVAVGAAGAAIPAVVKETWPVTERGKGEIPGQAARTVNPTVNRQKHGQSMGPQAWHPAADIGSAGVAVGAAGAAIPAVVKETWPITERGKGGKFQARRRGRLIQR